MRDRYQNIVRAVLETPWAIQESYLAVIVEVLAIRLEGGRFTDDELAARVGGKQPHKQAATSGATAIIPIYGTLIPRADAFTSMSGGTPVQRFQAELAAAVKDPDVANILLDVASPGGQVDLIPEAAADIRAARKIKPVVAIANTSAGSAAYWLASQASELVASPSAQVGSIGVFAAHDDLSAALEMKGIKTTLISAGKYKTELSPLGPLADEARAAAQVRVDDAYAMFTSDVAKGRRVPVDAVRQGFGEGRMLTAKQALREGMIDAIEPIEDTLARMNAGGGLLQAAPDEPDPDVVDIVDTGATATSVTAAAYTGTTTNTGLQPVSFTANLRRTLGAVEELVADARGLASVQRDGRLTGTKREQFRTLADALSAAGQVGDEIATLLAETDPNRPRADTVAIVAAHSARLAKDRGVPA